MESQWRRGKSLAEELQKEEEEKMRELAGLPPDRERSQSDEMQNNAEKACP
jgi:hypothetical protein